MPVKQDSPKNDDPSDETPVARARDLIPRATIPPRKDTENALSAAKARASAADALKLAHRPL